ncbi:hypothetical protein ABT297_32980 [Dactylosporangium sp. NPDC000555]
MVDYLSGYGDRRGKVLTSAVTLWVYFAPVVGVGNACRYSY